MAQYLKIDDENILKNFPKENPLEFTAIVDFNDLDAFFRENNDVFEKKFLIQINNIPSHLAMLNKYYLIPKQYKKDIWGSGTINGKNNYNIEWLCNANYQVWCQCIYGEEFDKKKENNLLIITKRFNQEEYPLYDNYFAVECSSVKDLFVDDVVKLKLDVKHYNMLKNTDLVYKVLEEYDDGTAYVEVEDIPIGVPITALQKIVNIYVVTDGENYYNPLKNPENCPDIHFVVDDFCPYCNYIDYDYLIKKINNELIGNTDRSGVGYLDTLKSIDNKNDPAPKINNKNKFTRLIYKKKKIVGMMGSWGDVPYLKITERERERYVYRRIIIQ